MPDESDVLPASRLVRWGAIAVLLGVAIALYFVAGTQVAPITATAPAAGSADSSN